MITPIETEYNGFRFRSRLEARWAVAFDAMCIEYEYEPEGFILHDGTKYLPDYRLKNVRYRGYDKSDPLYVEVKGEMTPEDLHKIEMFPYPIVVIGNIPKDVDGCWEQFLGHSYLWSQKFIDGDWYGGVFSKYKGEIWFSGPDWDTYDGGALMEIGIRAAKRARFEHGERGA